MACNESEVNQVYEVKKEDQNSGLKQAKEGKTKVDITQYVWGDDSMEVMFDFSMSANIEHKNACVYFADYYFEDNEIYIKWTRLDTLNCQQQLISEQYLDDLSKHEFLAKVSLVNDSSIQFLYPDNEMINAINKEAEKILFPKELRMIREI